ncbi:transcription factor E4F1 [Lingula anatina]|uniref:Zinc finger protein 865 n=1 Tax=Lingula anatina TaxID=7574 RepID=A0A2R2MPZ5_LINAN|nr:transcription factor E4F1 [Lingula anatina]|eukprot:XP_023932243.1 transcription factor E4F1 [Lingula anatina]
MSMTTRSKRGSASASTVEDVKTSSPPSKRTKVGKVAVTPTRSTRHKSVEDVKSEKECDQAKIEVGRSSKRNTTSGAQATTTREAKVTAPKTRNSPVKKPDKSNAVQKQAEQQTDTNQKSAAKTEPLTETDECKMQTQVPKTLPMETSNSTDLSDTLGSPLRRTSRKRVLSKRFQDMEVELITQQSAKKPTTAQDAKSPETKEGMARGGRKKEMSVAKGDQAVDALASVPVEPVPSAVVDTVEIHVKMIEDSKKDETEALTQTENTAEVQEVSVTAQPEDVDKAAEAISMEQQTAETAAILQELSDVLSSITGNAPVQQEGVAEENPQQELLEPSNGAAADNSVVLLVEPHKGEPSNSNDHSYGNSSVKLDVPVPVTTTTTATTTATATIVETFEGTRIMQPAGKGPNIVIVKPSSLQQGKEGGSGVVEETGEELENTTVYVDVVLKDGMFMYKCQECDYITNKKTNYYKHRKIHMTSRPHVCQHCNYKTSTSSNLKRHMSQHTNERNFKCTQCGLAFRQKIHLERHIKYRHEEKKVTCPYCDYTCANENPDLKQHIKRRHEAKDEVEGTFICHICNFTTSKRKDLKQHMKFHKKGPELKFYCSHCSFVTEAQSRLFRHELTHTKEKPYACGLCEYRATQREHVYRHMRSKHNISVAVKSRKKSISGLELDPSQSQQPSASDPQADLQAAPQLDPQADLQADPQAKTQADQQAETQAETQAEMQAETQVDQQAETQATSDKIKPQVETVNEVPPDSLEAKPDLNASLDGKPRKKYDPPDYSNADKLFACSYCTMSFAKLLNLYKHVHSMHGEVHPQDEEGVYSCVICDFRTSKKNNLLIHMRKHNVMDTEEDDDPYTSYACMLCEYRNKQRRNLFNHMKKKHKISIFLKKDGTASCVVDDSSCITIVQRDEEGTSGENVAIERDPITNKEKSVKLTDLARSLMSKQKVSGVISNSPNILGRNSHTVSQFVSLSPYDSNVVHHEAVEAIQGLQALAGDVVIESDGTLSAAPPMVDNVPTMPAATVTAVSVTGGAQGGKTIIGDAASDIQLSAEQLMNLSSGDYIEINGEMYKVEFTTSDDSPGSSSQNTLVVHQE